MEPESSQETANLRMKCNRKKKKIKAVPLHAMEAHEGRGGIAPTHT
jgi:hypothetical protein